MVRSRGLSLSFRRRLGFFVVLGVIVTAGCDGGTGKPNVKPGDSSTTYDVPPPPTLKDGKVVVTPGAKGKQGGSMSARELRDFKQKKQGPQP